MIKVYTIQVSPIAWQRAGVNTKYSEPKFYDKQTHDKIAYGLYLQQQHGTTPPFKGPLQVDIEFYLPIPKIKARRGSHIIFHDKKPDIDNLLKFLFDSCNKIIFTDDALISKLSVVKLYDKNPRTQLTIKDLE